MMKVVFVLLGLSALALAAPSLSNHSSIPFLDGRIIGGTPVDIYEYPYQVSLQYYGNHACGGSIISTRYVVTAAHCTYGLSASILTVRVGSTYHEFAGEVVGISEIHQHPHYNSENFDNDISILTLATEIFYSQSVQPIKLADSNIYIALGTLLTVTGWGNTSEGGRLSFELQMVKVPYVSQSYCSSVYDKSDITNNMLCAGFTSGGKDACQGDSGGPLTSNGLLVGIVSWGHGCARPYFPGVYSSIPAFRKYIKAITNL